MAELNLDYYKNTDLYSDGDIEDFMMEMAEKGMSYEDLPKKQVSFPILYHFSEIRENILNWYPFEKDASVLEIGAGCGAITGVLCEKAGRVVAVELSKRRASINFARHRDLDNLLIQVGNLNDMDFAKPFDYIVLNGVLEYAMSFTEGDRPYETFLQKLGRFLKPDGRFLIAIENRLGLKYFAGAPEDHTDLYYLGLNNYAGNDAVRTFSKTELTGLLQASGLPDVKYYYPYPDYKFPKEIFTDETLGANGYGKPYGSLTGKNLYFFDESKMTHSLVQEGAADVFANSFLVEAGRKEKKRDSQILYVKSNSERKKEFRISTMIVQENGEKHVIKKALAKEAEPFVQRMIENGKMEYGTSYKNLPCADADGSLSYAFIQGETLFDQVYRLVKTNEKEQLKALLKKFYEDCFANRSLREDYADAEFVRLFGETGEHPPYECVRPANIDVICDNVYMEQGTVIDYEWIFHTAIPAQFIMWRLINDLYSKVPELHQVIPNVELFDVVGIALADHERFLAWTKHFVYEYVGADPLNEFVKPALPVSLEQVREAELKRRFPLTKLYCDRGRGLNEQDAVEQVMHMEGNRFRVSFDLSEMPDATYLRWNISEEPCRCIIDHIECECRVKLLPKGTHLTEDGKITFFDNNPHFVLDVFDAGEVKHLVIQGRMEPLSRENLLEELKLRMEAGAADESRGTTEAEEPKCAAAETPVAEPMPQPGENPGLLRRAVRKARRIMGKTPMKTPAGEAVTAIGSVDLFGFDTHIIHAAGWVFDPAGKMEHAHIAYYDGPKKVAEHPYSVIHRSDVAQVMHNPEAEKGGFDTVARVLTPRELQMVLEYEICGATKSYPLGVIPANPSLSPEDEITVFEILEQGQLGNIRARAEEMLLEDCEIPPAVFGHTIDIIIPVYNGYDYLEALFSSLRRTYMSYRLLIVNDNSPDERVRPYLEAYAEAHSNTVLMHNEENLGFVGSVNRALSMAENHVVLLNTDVEVPAQWLERLMIPIICQEQVATATPFTNSGTICSFPNFCEDNDIFEGMRLWQVDQAFRTIRPSYPEIPTGVGFCMGVNIRAIRHVGLLDAETFGKGYGEENDWCRRAVEAGYKNVHVDNLFVYHKHCGSFPSEEKQKLLEQNSKALLAKHPDYNRVVADYCQADPARLVRLMAMLELLNEKTEVRTVLAIDHNLGGGATEYLENKKQEELKQGHKFLTLRFDIYSMRYLMEYQYKDYNIRFFANQPKPVLDMLGRVDEIRINEFVTIPGIYDLMERILRWKKEQGAYLLMLLHDYYAICPAINLMNEQGVYCQVGDVDTCNQCIPNNRSNACLEYENAGKWRESWERFLRGCDEVRAFSADSLALLEKVYPNLENTKLVPHKPHNMVAVRKKQKTTDTLNIGLLGVLAYKKGLPVIQKMLEKIEEENLNIRICLIGTPEEEIDSPAFVQTGRYSREQIPRLTLEMDIDVFFIPSIWPETFSYTTSEIMSMEMPLAVLEVGAPVERVKKYSRGCVIPRLAQPREILDRLQSLAKDCGIKVHRAEKKRVLFLAEEVSYATRYRVEHFREQMALAGYGSDFALMEEAGEQNLEGYRSIVFYRCNSVEAVEQMARRARELKIPLYYDIDDLVFDYDRISYLEFLKGEEYKTFPQLTEAIHRCMELCDGFMTSTCTLEAEIRREFPGKPVVIKRNVASMEMQILSMDACEHREEPGEQVRIGYFSGSHTHDKDFAIVEQVLIELLEKYPQVQLVLGGVFDNVKLSGYQKRITKLPFMEWQKLPGIIANTDINLMPLEDTLFHGCKSENKWTEAGLVHVPSVMSDNPEMRGVICDGKDGFLCADEKQWMDTLERLICDDGLRKSTGDAAYEKVMQRYTTEGTAKDAIRLVIGETV